MYVLSRSPSSHCPPPPPSRHRLGQAGSVTHIPSTRATTMLFDDQIDDDRKSKTIYNLTRLISSSLAYSRMLLPAHSLVENSRCTFQGNVRDQADCQCRRKPARTRLELDLVRLAYFACKDELITRFQCPDKHLFDDDLRSCNDYRKVFCANRPTRGHGNEPCNYALASGGKTMLPF